MLLLLLEFWSERLKRMWKRWTFLWLLVSSRSSIRSSSFTIFHCSLELFRPLSRRRNKSRVADELAGGTTASAIDDAVVLTSSRPSPFESAVFSLSGDCFRSQPLCDGLRLTMNASLQSTAPLCRVRTIWCLPADQRTDGRQFAKYIDAYFKSLLWGPSSLKAGTRLTEWAQ